MSFSCPKGGRKRSFRRLEIGVKKSCNEGRLTIRLHNWKGQVWHQLGGFSVKFTYGTLGRRREDPYTGLLDVSLPVVFCVCSYKNRLDKHYRVMTSDGWVYE